MHVNLTGSILVNLFVKGGSPKFGGCLLQMRVRQRTVKQIKKGGVRSKYLVKSSTLQPCPTSACRDCVQGCPQLTDSLFLQCQRGGEEERLGAGMTQALKLPVLPHVSCILSHPCSGSTKRASTLAWFLSKLWGCSQCPLSAELNFHWSATGNIQQIFNRGS